MKTNTFFGVLLLALFYMSCKDTKTTAKQTEPSSPATIYFNGDIITMVDSIPQYAQALVSKQGKIEFVGNQESAFKIAGTNPIKKDLNGATLLPGFIDSHGHMYNTGMLAMAANVLPAPDGPGDDFNSIVEVAKEWMTTENGKFLMSKTGWIMIYGYDDSRLKEKTHPTRELLDKISTTMPVMVIHQSTHLGCLNSKGLEMVGYNKNTKDVAGGKIKRDKDGNPTGVLEEAAFFDAILPILTKNTDEELQLRSVQNGQEEYAKYGYTTAQDGRSSSDVTSAYKIAAAQNKFFIDVVSYPDIIWNAEAMNSEFYTTNKRYKNHYRIGGVKLVLDGSPQGKTAWLSKCYHVNPDGEDGCYEGYPILPDSTATAYVTRAFKNKWQIIAHTNGDRAIDQYLNAIRTAINTHGYPDHRSVMIHGQTLRKDQIPSLVSLNILPSLFPMHTFYWGDWHRESVLGEARAAYISPTRDVLNAGLTVTSHHDAPVTFPNSLRVLDATVNRVTRTNYVLGPDQRLTPYEGLKTLTEWAAIQHFEEDYKGTLETGKLADFVILDKNPLKIDPLTIHKIQVLETIKEGKVVYEKGHMVGAYTDSEIDLDIKEAATFAAQTINNQVSVAHISEAKKQVVNGLNFTFTLTLSNKEVWQVTVYRSTDGIFSLIEKNKITS
ncbi:amidohydrolase [Bizionia sediminis]|uniref:Amidohydrolase n=1 Tax=Bizionia sediminis TaxID=1737064 RepID=A0ABW5KWU0_9FLAO